MINAPVIFWFRRDLRLRDNHGLYRALKSGRKVKPLFIFDSIILSQLDQTKDARVQFIYGEIERLKQTFKEKGSDLMVRFGKPEEVFKTLLNSETISAVYTNRDYEPYARERDEKVKKIVEGKGSRFCTYKDHVIFEKSEIVKEQGIPYKVFTPYSKKWLQSFEDIKGSHYPSQNELQKLAPFADHLMPSIEEMGFERFDFKYYPSREINLPVIQNYHKTRDIPELDATSHLALHLRFGTISVRKLAKTAAENSTVYLKELIWRDFYQMILWHFPHVVNGPFKKNYAGINWRNNEEEFETWCQGKTGYPIVDAGMRQLNETGFMHNRVRMIVASFLTKHLLIDWQWGEAYFAGKLLDYEQASNNGGWQWAASTGNDAVPYFRIFNPELQTLKFDPELKYIKKWVPELQEITYPKPIVEHKTARERAIQTYKQALT